MTSSHRTTLRALAALSACAGPLILSACAAAGARSAAVGAESSAGNGERERKIELAELRVEQARIEAEQGGAEARVGLELAQRKLAAARQKLTVFEATHRAIRLEEARLELDRAIGRAADAAAELGELEAMYAEEEFAEKTKELVLTRGRRNLEHAQRGVAIGESKLEKLQRDELPAEERELERAVVEAEGKLQAARLALPIAELKGRVALAEAETKLAEARKGESDDDES